MSNKLKFNADWYECDDPDATEAARIAYIQTRIAGKASDFLGPFLDAKEDREEDVAVEDIIQYLQSVFEDPDQRIKARQELRSLKMKPSDDFNQFLANFMRLANLARTPQDQWKEDFHEMLHSELRIHMKNKYT